MFVYCFIYFLFVFSTNSDNLTDFDQLVKSCQEKWVEFHFQIAKQHFLIVEYFLEAFEEGMNLLEHTLFFYHKFKGIYEELKEITDKSYSKNIQNHFLVIREKLESIVSYEIAYQNASINYQHKDIYWLFEYEETIIKFSIYSRATRFNSSVSENVTSLEKIVEKIKSCNVGKKFLWYWPCTWLQHTINVFCEKDKENVLKVAFDIIGVYEQGKRNVVEDYKKVEEIIKNSIKTLTESFKKIDKNDSKIELYENSVKKIKSIRDEMDELIKKVMANDMHTSTTLNTTYSSEEMIIQKDDAGRKLRIYFMQLAQEYHAIFTFFIFYNHSFDKKFLTGTTNTYIFSLM